MPEYRIFFKTIAEGQVVVYSDEPVAEDDFVRREELIEEAWQELPSLCAQCSGWGSKNSLHISNDWDLIDDETGEPLITRVDD